MTEFTIEQYVEDWTHPLPDDPTAVWDLRVALEKCMHEMRMEILEDEKYRRVRDPHNHLKRSSQQYRAYIRLATRLNLLLRYYGFDGGRRRTSALDFLPPLYRIAKSIDDLSPEEQKLLEWVKLFVEEKTGDSLQGGDFLPDTSNRMKYSEIRQEVLDGFTGNEHLDLESWDKRPEKWVAQDEWHTERIRRQREERRSQGADYSGDDYDSLDG